MIEPTPTPSVTAGRARLRAHAPGLSAKGTKPEGGIQRMRTPKNQASTMPSQKTGTARASPWYQPQSLASQERGCVPA